MSIPTIKTQVEKKAKKTTKSYLGLHDGLAVDMRIYNKLMVEQRNGDPRAFLNFKRIALAMFN